MKQINSGEIFCIDRADIFNDHICYILHFLMTVPQLIKQLHVLLKKRYFHVVDLSVGVIAVFTSLIHGSESCQRHISSLNSSIINGREAHYILASGVGFKFSLSANSISALFGNSTLDHFTK